VPPNDPDGRTAVLHYRERGRTAWGSWIEVELETGRTHQIRVQAASRGWPVLGDAFYGSTITFGTQHQDERLRSIALHGRSIGFRHPMTREEVTVEALLPLDWQALELGSVAV
jgi:23S rRNA pseudouridine1911/1915/1917 synthase